MRKSFQIVRVLFILMLGVLTVPAQAQSMSINPTSGPPGTAVTLIIDSGDPVRECYANGAFIGDGAAPYIVPPEAQGTIVFRCDVGLGGEFMVSTNDAVFTVTQPPAPTDPPPPTAPPADPPPAADGTIGIGVNPASGTPPINVVLSINLTGSATVTACFANGNPFSPPNYVVPEGMTGSVVFRCDGQLSDGRGISSNEAVFTIVAPSAPVAPTVAPPPAVEPPPAVILPPLPDDGVCYVATEGGAEVNVRAEPTTDSPIVASMDPSAFYEATQFEEVGENRWYFVPSLGGWVAGFVVRATVPCADVGFAPMPLIEIPPEFDDCPDLHAEIATWPPHVINDLLDADDPCDAAFELWSDRLFGDAIPLDFPAGDGFDDILADCPERVFELTTIYNYLMLADFDAAQTLIAAMEAQGCAVDIYALFPPEYFRTAAGLGLVVVAECGTTPDDALAFGQRLMVLDIIDGLELRDAAPCELVRALDDISRDDLELFIQLEICGVSHIQALWYLVFAQVNNIHMPSLITNINTNRDGFCADPLGFMRDLIENPDVAGLDPSRVPPELQRCPRYADRLAGWRDPITGEGVSMETLITILNSAHPCETARRFLAGEDVSAGALLTSECRNYGDDGRYYIELGGERISDSADWRTKLQAVRMRNSPCEFLAEQIAGFPPSRPRACYAVSYWFQALDPLLTASATVNVYHYGPNALDSGRTAEYQLVNPVTRRWSAPPFWDPNPRHIGFVTWIYHDPDDTFQPSPDFIRNPWTARTTNNAELVRDISWEGFVDNSLCLSGGVPIVVFPEFDIDPSWFIDPVDRDIWRIPLEIPPIIPFPEPDPFIRLPGFFINFFPEIDLSGLNLQPPEEEPPVGFPPPPNLDLPSGLIGRGGDIALRDRLILGDLRPSEQTLYFALESRCEFNEFDIYQILYFADDSDDYTPEDFTDLLRIVPDETCDDLRELTSGSFSLEDGTPFFLPGLIDGLDLGRIGFALDLEAVIALRAELASVCGLNAAGVDRAMNALFDLGLSPSDVLESLRTFPPEVCIGLLSGVSSNAATAQAMVDQCFLNEADAALGVALITSALDHRDTALGALGDVLVYLFASDVDLACAELRGLLGDAESRASIEMLDLTIDELLIEVCGIAPEQVSIVLNYLFEIEGGFTEDELRNAFIMSSGYICDGLNDILRDRDELMGEIAGMIAMICGFSPEQSALIVSVIDGESGLSGLTRAFELLSRNRLEGCGVILRENDTREVLIGTIGEVCGFTPTQADDALAALESRGAFSRVALLNSLADDAERMCGDLADLIGLVAFVSDTIRIEIPPIVIPRPDDDPEEAMPLDPPPDEPALGTPPEDHSDPADEPEEAAPLVPRPEDAPEVVTVDEEDLPAALIPPPAPADESPAPPSAVGTTPPARIVVVTDTSTPRNAAGAPVQLAGLPDNPQVIADYFNQSGFARAGFTLGAVQIERDGRDDVYLLRDDGLTLLSGDMPGGSILPAISPDGDFVAFLSQRADGTYTLRLADATGRTNRVTLIDIGDFDLLPFAPAWTPDGDNLLITVTGTEGRPSIYMLEGLPEPSGWRLLEADGASPAIESGGRYMAFVRDGDIFSKGLSGTTSRFVHRDEADCQQTTFGADPFVLYFVCGETAYRYDSSGVNALSIPVVTQVTTGGVGRLLTFSDGAVIFIARDDGSQQETLIRQDGARAIYFDWLR